MKAFLLGTKGIFNRAAAVLPVAGLWLLVPMGLAFHEQAGDARGERRVLELLSTQARDPGLRDLALPRLAGLKAVELEKLKEKGVGK